MKHLKRFCFIAFLCYSSSFIWADVLLDHFDDSFDSNPDQCHLGEAYGYAIFTDTGVAEGGGFWTSFADEWGTLTTNGQGVPFDTQGDNMGTMVEKDGTNGYMHVFFKTHLSTANFDDQWPFSGVSCGIIGDGTKYFDFTNLTEVSLKIKGSGKIRILFETQDVAEITDWGFYGVDKSLSADWEDFSIPVGLLQAEADSPPDSLKWTWDHGKAAVRAFVIQAIPDDDTATKDSADLFVDNITLKGLDYQSTFGFTFDTLINPIIYQVKIPQANNIQIVQNRDANTLQLSYKLEKASDVNISMVDLRGKIIAELVNGRQAKGQQMTTAALKAELTSGVYFINVRINDAFVTRKFNFVK